MTIDRIDRSDPRGYHIDNIQVMSLSENAKKYHDVDQYRDPPEQLVDGVDPNCEAPF